MWQAHFKTRALDLKQNQFHVSSLNLKCMIITVSKHKLSFGFTTAINTMEDGIIVIYDSSRRWSEGNWRSSLQFISEIATWSINHSSFFFLITPMCVVMEQPFVRHKYSCCVSQTAFDRKKEVKREIVLLLKVTLERLWSQNGESIAQCVWVQILWPPVQSIIFQYYTLQQ